MSGTPLVLDRWACLEWLFDGANGTHPEAAEPRMWLDGVELAWPERFVFSDPPLDTRYMERRDITPLGVDIYTPDFLAIARGFGCEAERARDYEHLQALLRNAPSDRPLIVEVMEAAPFAP